MESLMGTITSVKQNIWNDIAINLVNAVLFYIIYFLLTDILYHVYMDTKLQTTQ